MLKEEWNVNGKDIATAVKGWNVDLATSPDADMLPELIASRQVLEQDFKNYVTRVKETLTKDISNEDLLNLYREASRIETYYDGVQLIAKINANSLYGYLGAKFAKLYNKAVAADITADGRNLLKMVDKYIVEYFDRGWPKETEFFAKLKEKYPQIKAEKPVSLDYGGKPIAVYGDTDSLFFKLDKLVDSLEIEEVGNTETITYIIRDITEGPMMRIIDGLMENYILNRNGENHYVFELEAILRRGIFLAKKKYVGSYLFKDGVYVAKDMKLKATGIELSQKTTPHMIKDDIKKLVYYLLMSKRLDDKTMFHLFRLLVTKYDKVHPDMWVKSRSLGKMDKYVYVDPKSGFYRPLKGADAVTKGAIKYNNEVIKNGLQREYPLIKQGNKVKYYIQENGETFSYPISDEARYPEKIAPEINTRATLKSLLFDPVKRIMEMTTTQDMSLIGSNVYSEKISMFKKK